MTSHRTVVRFIETTSEGCDQHRRNAANRQAQCVRQAVARLANEA